MTAIDTAKVTDRRQLHFTTLQEIGAEVDKLARSVEVRSLGNWTPGQVLQHLTLAMNNSIDGTLPNLPGIVRFFLRLLFKNRFLNKPMPPGFQLPASAKGLLPPPTTWEEGLHNFRQALARLLAEEKRVPHPAIGPLTNEEWTRMHCRHSELHLSFLVAGA